MNESNDAQGAPDDNVSSCADLGEEKPATQSNSPALESAADTDDPEVIGDSPIRVVAIGASAGGLEPIEQFFNTMSVDSGVAFVIVQHLSPDFRSMMDQLIARHSKMTIRHAEDGMAIQANMVYLNPPRTELTISKGRLRTRDYTDPETLGLPIDSFFSSLANDQGDKAIGIIMSGTGSDGSRGGLAIHEAGGTVIVQDPESAKFDSMPRAAIDRGAATLTAKPPEMPAWISRLIEGESIVLSAADSGGFDGPEQSILSMLQKRYGADFGYYRQTTVGRRIGRRALLNQIHSLQQYAEFVGSNPEELEALYCDLLIGVTAFFRDKEGFDLLGSAALPILASTMSERRQIRIWVPGCASGEEAYSLAILVAEFARTRGLTLNLKVFATDLHFNSLERAGAAYYDQDGLKGLPDRIVNTYFERIGDRYQVKQNIRQLVVFSAHNLIKDPPFTRMDLVSCRNLLIYLDEIAQKKVIALFHFALRKDGVLFLGPSETTGDLESEFEVIDSRWRIYRKIRDVRLREATNMLPLSTGGTDDGSARQLHESSRNTSHAVAVGAHQRQSLMASYDAVLKRFAPSSLLIDRSGELVHVFGDAERYLRVAGGVFSRKVADLVHPDLKLVVSAGLERALAQHSVPIHRNAKITLDDGTEQTVMVDIQRLDEAGSKTEHWLLTLKAKAGPVPDVLTPAVGEDVDKAFYVQRIDDLEQDLRSTEENLQTSIEELGTSNEEMQATNEELMASNEELQSTNEELHSVNEELYTVSAEHQRKIEELTQLTEDMDNLLRATNIGTIFLDPLLRIRRFTPSAARTFNLVEHDIGRPFQHITYRFTYSELIDDIENVCVNGDPRQSEIDVDGRAYLLNIMPYRSYLEDNTGAVLTVIDIQELKEAQQLLSHQQELFEAVVEQQRDLICRYKPNFVLTYVNESLCRHYGKTRDELLDSSALDLFPKATREMVRTQTDELKAGETDTLTLDDVAPDGSTRWLHYSRFAQPDPDGGISEIQAVGRDFTALKQAQQALQEQNEELARINENLNQFTHIVSHDLTGPLRAIEHTADWIEQDAAPEARKGIQEHIDRLKDQVTQLGSLLSDLLEYSRAGTTEQSPEVIDLPRSLNDIFDVIDKPDGMQLAMKSLPNDMVTYRAPLLLVFRNLIENAVKYHDSETGKIVVRSEDLGDRWQFAVEDDGPGIDPKFHDKILLPFRKLERKNTAPGNGMGLALVKKAVETNGGKLEILSNPLERPGTRFTFTWSKNRLQSIAAE